MNTLQRIALALTIIGAINWGLIGFFRFDLVAAIFGGQTAALARVVYALVGISGLVCISLLFKQSEASNTNEATNNNKTNYGNLGYGTEFAEENNAVDTRKTNKDEQ